MTSPPIGNPRTDAEAETLVDLAAMHTVYGLARRLGLKYPTVQTWVRKARIRVGPDYKPKTPEYDPVPPKEAKRSWLPPAYGVAVPATLAAGEKPRVRVKAGSRYDHFARPFTIVYFTDAHNCPALEDLSRFTWLARLINEVRPDAVVDGGDFDDIGSLCGHERNETYAGRFKPGFQADLEASERAQAHIAFEIKHPCPLYRTEGNHEARIDTFENDNPETFGTYSFAYRDIAKRYGWRLTPYRGWLDLQGVDVTHVPMNGMNRPASGLRPHVTLAPKLSRDLLFGHTHSFGSHVEQRMGPAPGRSIRVINGGCFMVDGYMPRYSAGAMKEFWYGAHVIQIEGGRITGHEPITMRQLEARYS